jgi:hypothetical protein
VGELPKLVEQFSSVTGDPKRRGFGLSHSHAKKKKGFFLARIVNNAVLR